MRFPLILPLTLACTASLLAACKPATPPTTPPETAASPADNPLLEKPAAAMAAAATLATAETHIGDLQVRLPRVLETPTVGGTGVAFMVIANLGDRDDRLLAASSPVADSVELHEVSMADGVMRMRALADGLAIPVGAAVELKPGGYHLMLIGVHAPLAVGDSVAVELQFEQAGRATVTMPVQARQTAP